jgi:hypothetical protein
MSQIDGAKFFYCVGQLNYVPKNAIIPLIVKNWNDSKTSCSVLCVIAKLGLDEGLKGFIPQCVSDVVREGSVSECANSFLALSSMARLDLCNLDRVLERLESSQERLNEIDMHQLEKALAILMMLESGGSATNTAMLLRLWKMLSKYPSLHRRKPPTNTSRSHKEIMKSLSSICVNGGKTVKSEIFIPPISSYIDIQIS